MSQVSIILPTYNRARFLPEAIASIRDQQFTDWELIIVDDGSTDETPELLLKLIAEIAQPVRIIRQDNQGAYVARNTGLDHARDKYIAFFDSDDLWLPHHLHDCVGALEANPDVDWVYGACKLVDADSGEVMSESTFYDGDSPKPFLSLPREQRGQLHVLLGPRLLERVLNGAGLYAGLQNSVIRATVFARRRFAVTFYNEAEDQLAVVRSLTAGRRFGYLDRIHVLYQVHDQNSSGASRTLDGQKQIRLMEGLVQGYESLLGELVMSRSERRALQRHVARLAFWRLGYSTLWPLGLRREAFAAYRRAMRHWPWDWRYWKAIGVGSLKSLRKPRARDSST